MDDLPFLDFTAHGFSTRGPEVAAAREASPLARTPFGLAVLRHQVAGRVLRDRRCRQGSHDWPRKVGLTGSFADFWMASVISQEGPEHKRLRQIIQTALAEAHILALRPAFTRIASDLLDGMGEEVEFVEAFSEPFAGRAITTLLGLPEADAPSLAHDASTLGLAMGVDAKRYEDRVNAATDRLFALAERLLDDPPAGSLTARMLGAAEALGVTDRAALQNLVVISIFGGVDTTRAQLAFAVALFIERPETWARLRADPALIPDAIEDVIRHRPTTTWATREAVEDMEIDGVRVPAGATLHVLVNATATDPDAGYSGEGHAGGFDPAARRKGHFGFGGGAHHCLGHLVARTDMACALAVLAKRVERFEWAGTPDYLPDSGNTSPRALPVRVVLE
ncbi:MAG: cytochrome P450 [Pseudomonadota bacterium]